MHLRVREVEVIARLLLLKNVGKGSLKKDEPSGSPKAYNMLSV
jgi:hypothetical protein